MRPHEWNAALRPSVPIPEAYAVIATVARHHLIHNTVGGPLTTFELVEALYPIRFARVSSAAMAARERIKKALTKRALGTYALADCMSEGPSTWLPWLKLHGRPAMWHAPRNVSMEGQVYAHE